MKKMALVFVLLGLVVAGCGSMEAPPTGPPASKKPQPATKGPSAAAPELHWNVWAENRPGSPFQPVTHLRPNTKYRLCLDLAALQYQIGPLAFPTSQSFRGEVENWLEQGMRPPNLRVLLLADPSKFETDRIVEDFQVDLEGLRKVWQSGYTKTKTDAFADLREAHDKGKKPDFKFGGVYFDIQTKDREGQAPAAFSIWYDGRPIDEVSFQLCIAETTATMAEKCQIDGNTADTQGLLSVRAASEKSEPPAAAVHFVSLGLGERVTGIFRVNGWAKEDFLVWQLPQSAIDFRNTISKKLDGLSAPELADDNLLRRGEALLLDLFPPEARSFDGRKVHDEVLNFFRPQLQKDRNGPEYLPPTIFVRMIQAGPSPCAPVPLGLLAVRVDRDKDMIRENGKFLGEYFLIETPLEVQSYRPSTECLSRVVMVLPPEDQEIRDDRDLANALEQLSPALATWSVPKENFYHQMNKLADWLFGAPGSDQKEPSTILVTLSHHNSNSLYFYRLRSIKDDPLYPSHIIRKFAQPSVAILNGCGTGAEGAVELIRALNHHGFTTIIATSTEINGSLAGAFLRVFSEEISTPKPVGLAYWRAVKKLAETKPVGKPGGPFGAKALKFSLLGNGKVQICLPQKKQAVATP